MDQVFQKSTVIKASLSDVFDFFSNAKNLETITPPWLKFNITHQTTPSITKGTVFTYQLTLHGIRFTWKSLIEEWENHSHFVDSQIKGPYKKWHHLHTFKETSQGTLVEDIVHYQLHFGQWGQTIAGWWVKKEIETIFNHREKIIHSVF